MPEPERNPFPVERERNPFPVELETEPFPCWWSGVTSLATLCGMFVIQSKQSCTSNLKGLLDVRVYPLVSLCQCSGEVCVCVCAPLSVCLSPSLSLPVSHVPSAIQSTNPRVTSYHTNSLNHI